MTNVINSFGALCYPSHHPSKALANFVKDNLNMEVGTMLHVIKRAGRIRAKKGEELVALNQKIRNLEKLIARSRS